MASGLAKVESPPTRRIVAALGWLLLVSAATPGRAADAPAPTAEQAAFFEAEVRPILAESCQKCHGTDKQKGGLRLDTPEGVFQGGDSGPAVVPGNLEESLLIEAIRHEGLEMPPSGKLDDVKIATLTRWVETGAAWPGVEGHAAAAPAPPTQKIFTAEDRAWWSFQPLRRPEVPDVDDGGWAKTPIDRFVFARLEAQGLEPAAEADRRALIRRLTFDLTGLPPTPEDVDAFVADPDPDAYEHLVDRLLDSPRYGERWARHWLDLVRYAESDGYNQDAYRPDAWRYRDYVIRSLNADKPYDRFLTEQLAGDEIAPGNLEMMVAVSYFRLGTYEYNQSDVRTHRADIINDITDVSADVFLGLGMGCARCHDHKFDPILQKDYYRFQAFFQPLIPRNDIPLASPDEVLAYQRPLADWDAVTAEIRAEIDEIERPQLEKLAHVGYKKIPPDVRPILDTSPERRTPHEQQLALYAGFLIQRECDKFKGTSLKGEVGERWKALQEQLARYEQDKPRPLPGVLTITDVGPIASPVVIPGDRSEEPIEPGFPTILDPRPARVFRLPGASNSTGRRATLAQWLTRSDNPLSTRVIANRIWQYHFGRGLVATSSDFGHLGEMPSHPELLDWLATEFVDQGWSLKTLHRLILTSATYQQTALRPAPKPARLGDPENRQLWRANTRRPRRRADPRRHARRQRRAGPDHGRRGRERGSAPPDHLHQGLAQQARPLARRLRRPRRLDHHLHPEFDHDPDPGPDDDQRRVVDRPRPGVRPPTGSPARALGPGRPGLPPGLRPPPRARRAGRGPRFPR